MYTGVKSIVVYLSNRVGNLCTELLATITGHNYFFQHFGVFLQLNVQRSTRPFHFQSSITHERNLDDVTLLYIRKSKVTIKISNHTICGTFYHYRSTDNGTHCIHYGTSSCFTLLDYRSLHLCITGSRHNRSC